MFAVVIPILTSIEDTRARAGVALAIPLAANVGGIATPVGTPPNAIAIGALSANGINVSFAHWTMMATPFALVILFASWMLICVLFIPRGHSIDLDVEVGDTVKVISGPFESFMGVVEEVSMEKQTLKVRISMFGRDTPVELEFGQVDKI